MRFLALLCCSGKQTRKWVAWAESENSYWKNDSGKEKPQCQSHLGNSSQAQPSDIHDITNKEIVHLICGYIELDAIYNITGGWWNYWIYIYLYIIYLYY